MTLVLPVSGGKPLASSWTSIHCMDERSGSPGVATLYHHRHVLHSTAGAFKLETTSGAFICGKRGSMSPRRIIPHRSSKGHEASIFPR